MAHLLYGVNGMQHGGLEEDLFGDGGAAVYAAAAAAGLNSADDSLPYSTSELNAPEYSTDDFRMFQFKVARCSKRYVHDWRACPFAHPTENARRRDPRLVKYQPIPCPDYKRGICLRGDSCSYSHGVYECWLHPAKYRTQLCKEGPNCRRPVCFFAHSVLDLRQPSHMFDHSAGGAEDMSTSVAAVLAQQAAQQQQQAAAAVAAAAAAGAAAAAAQQRLSSDAAFQQRLSSDAAFQQRLSTEEMLNNMQDSRASVDGTAAPPQSGSPNGSRQSSFSGSGSGHSRSGGSASGSPERSGSPNTPGQPGPLDGPAHRSLEAPPAGVPTGLPSDAAAAMALLTQQQQAQAAVQAQAQAAAALARLSMDNRGSLDAAAAARASLDAAAAAATTQAMLQHAGSGGLPPRMSLDSLLATRQAAAGGWVPGALPPQGATAAAALAAGPPSSLPLNEQPFPSGNAPRMSNAVARKLGLAPHRTSLDARLGKLARGPGMATPPRTSIDGILAALQLQQQQQQGGSGRSSLDQQAASAMLQAMGNNPQLAHMAGLNGLQPGLNNGYGGAPAPTYPPANNYGGGPSGGEAMGLHPALLSLVAAQMQGGGPAPPAGVPAGGMHSGLGSQHGSDANMAALVDSLNGWQLGGPGGPGPASMGHRGSMDGMTGMAGAPQGMSAAQAAGGPGGPGGPGYYDGKAIWGNGSNEALNNASGSDS
jgi:hypothetical protein